MSVAKKTERKKRKKGSIAFQIHLNLVVLQLQGKKNMNNKGVLSSKQNLLRKN